MAEGFARHIAGDKVSVSSGGSRPASKVNPNAIKVMKEEGIDISSQKPTPISTEDSESSDFVVSMGRGSEARPAPLDGKNIE